MFVLNWYAVSPQHCTLQGFCDLRTNPDQHCHDSQNDQMGSTRWNKLVAARNARIISVMDNNEACS